MASSHDQRKLSSCSRLAVELDERHYVGFGGLAAGYVGAFGGTKEKYRLSFDIDRIIYDHNDSSSITNTITEYHLKSQFGL